MLIKRFAEDGGGVTEVMLDTARSTAARRAMAEIVNTLDRAHNILGGVDAPLSDVAAVIGQLGELCLVHMLTVLNDDATDAELEALLKALNDVLAVKVKTGKSLRDVFTSVRSKVKERDGE